MNLCAYLHYILAHVSAVSRKTLAYDIPNSYFPIKHKGSSDALSGEPFVCKTG